MCAMESLFIDGHSLLRGSILGGPISTIPRDPVLRTVEWKGKTIEIRKINSYYRMQLVGGLRYQIYIEEMRRTQEFADHTFRKIVEPIDEFSIVLGAFVSETGECIATGRIQFSNTAELPYEDFYQYSAMVADVDRPALVTKLMIKPEYRRSILCRDICEALYELCLQNGTQYVFIDSNLHLVSLYQRMGFIAYGEPVNHPVYGTVLRMILPVMNAEHLKSTKSSFYKILMNDQPNSNQAVI